MVFEGDRKTALLRLMVVMMASDREIHERERSLIKDVHLKLTQTALTDVQMNAEIATAAADKRDLAGYLRDVAPEYTEEEKELVLRAVFLVGLADGVYRDAEEEVLAETAATLGVSRERLHEIVTEILTTEHD